MADFNLDGLVDLVVVNRWESAQIWRNATPNPGRWIEVKLHQEGPNRDAIGAWIEVKCDERILRREITVGGGHASGQNGWWHFGLGNTEKPELRVIWPDGAASAWQSVVSNNFLVLERNKPLRVWTVK